MLTNNYKNIDEKQNKNNIFQTIFSKKMEKHNYGQ